MTASFIPVDQLEDGHTLVLGTTGSGKTYQVRGLLEQLRRADRRVGAIDKLGNHWGLTLDRDSANAGLDFIIFGGKRAQVPMGPDQGEAIARLFLDKNLPAIFDLSQWPADDQAQWVAAFAETVFRFNDGALHLSIDEAQSFVPTNGGGKEAAGDAYRAVRLLAEQGRGNGVRLLLACQRLSRIDSTVREMMHTVVVMRQVGTIDRKAVKDLISADAEQAALIERELPRLPVGTGYVWQAGGTDLRQIKFGENTTFDSSRTPRHGDAPPPPVAVSSDLVEDLRAALAPVAAAETEERSVTWRPGVDPAVATLQEENAMLIGDVFLRDQQIERLSTGLRHLADEIEQLLGEAGDPPKVQRENADSQGGVPAPAPSRLDDLGSVQDGLQMSTDGPPAAGSVQPPRTPALKRVTAGETAPPDIAVRGRKALLALASVHPAALSERQWASLAGYAATGGTWGTYKSALRAAGLVEQVDGRWRAAAAGVAAAGGGVVPIPPPGPDRARFWDKRVAAGRLIDVLLKRWPHWTSRDSLAADGGYAASGGTFGTYLGRLRANGLTEERGKKLRLSADVMGGAL